MTPAWMLSLALAVGCTAGSGDDVVSDPEGCTMTLPFESTCSFSGIATCSSSFVCSAGTWTCSEGGRQVAARGCLATCEAYATDHPGCRCEADTYGYETRVVCL